MKVDDKLIEENTPEIDKMCKPELQKIAEEIIAEFDSTNINNDFEFLELKKNPSKNFEKYIWF